MVAIVIAVFAVIGGVGGSIYVSYFGTAVLMIIAVVFLADAFYDPLDRDEQRLGDIET